MRLLVLAGGRGTRLDPLTRKMPKPMVPIHGKPFIQYLLEYYSDHDLVLSLGYKFEQIKKFCKKNKFLVEYVVEYSPLGTMGAIRYAYPFLRDHKYFAVINGDTFIEEDLTPILLHHKHSGAMITDVTAINIMTGKRQHAGIYIFSNPMADYDSVKRNEYSSDKGFIDIGTHESLRYCKEKMFMEVPYENL